jgi:hypothetical protein
MLQDLTKVISVQYITRANQDKTTPFVGVQLYIRTNVCKNCSHVMLVHSARQIPGDSCEFFPDINSTDKLRLSGHCACDSD